MIPKRVTLENFLSFGPRTEIAFTDDEPLWVLGGPNGVGKSAVFDAITFCLFGAHRGGAKEIDPLIRHGSNGFSVSFEFEFCGMDYRITRSRLGKTTQAVEQWKPDAAKWERVANINSVNDVRGWVERTLGLPFDAFKASVLLRQGEADAIITAGGTERLKILKKIIAVERYEELSKRVHEASRGKQVHCDQLSEQLSHSPEVTEEERAVATRAVTEREQARNAAHDVETAATTRVEQARQWVSLDGQLTDLNERILAADQRRASALKIRERYHRLIELDGVVSTTRELVVLRQSRIGADVAALRQAHLELVERQRVAAEATTTSRALVEQHRGEVDAATTVVRELEQRLKDDRIALSTAEEVERVDDQLTGLPANLDDLLSEAEAAARDAESAARTTADRRSAAAESLRLRRQELDDFASVEIGPRCLRCHQPISHEHVERERNELTALIGRLQIDAHSTVEAQAGADDRLLAARTELSRLNAAATKRGGLTTRRLTLLRHGPGSPAADLRARIAEANPQLTQQLERLEKARTAQRTAIAAVTRHEGERVSAEGELARTDAKLKSAEAELVKTDARRTALASTLRGNWATAWETLSLPEADALTDELRILSGSGVREEFQRLQDDDARREEWERQRAETLGSIEAIPPEARVSVDTATATLAAARHSTVQRMAEWDRARREFDEQTGRMERRARLQEQVRLAETDSRTHARLDELLGKTGLQRELVRDAETQIVRLANDTVRQLSDGELSIELDHSDDSDDEAFALRVRRADDPTPIGVAYLSGSQKFRVAISVALAIGRFAAGQARPLECVIIDEGFGSLDKDGLRAAAEELNRLKQYLRRIILVSHQEEFTDHFPVVIQLRKGEGGTTAEAVRR